MLPQTYMEKEKEKHFKTNLFISDNINVVKSKVDRDHTCMLNAVRLDNRVFRM